MRVTSSGFGKEDKAPILIFVDSRENKPYWTATECAKHPLLVGDYTTYMLLNVFHIERKSPADLYGTLTQGWQRFTRELARAKEANIKLVVVVESTYEDFVERLFPYGNKLKYPTDGLKRIIKNLESPKFGLEFVWCPTRKEAKSVVLNRLLKEETKLKKQSNAHSKR